MENGMLNVNVGGYFGLLLQVPSTANVQCPSHSRSSSPKCSSSACASSLKAQASSFSRTLRIAALETGCCWYSWIPLSLKVRTREFGGAEAHEIRTQFESLAETSLSVLTPNADDYCLARKKRQRLKRAAWPGSTAKHLPSPGTPVTE